jgi:soluble lytic murein transglycosylase-like protein
MCKAAFISVNLPGELGAALARKESGFIPETTVLYGPDGDRGGAYGMFCMTVKTARGLGFTDEPDTLLDPATCALWAGQLCVQNWERFDGDLEDVICAYNSGKPKKFAPAITVADYLPKVIKYMGIYKYFKVEVNS